jgi:serine/threonine protein kinase
MSDLIGQTLGEYKIVGLVGKGGMATVYRAEQASLGRTVAVKVLPRNFTHDDTFLQRFTREVQTIARLQHPRILPVYAYGEFDSLPYIVMAYMEGGTLADRISQGQMPLEEISQLLGQTAEGLDYAHSKGVIHRDFKPSNILLDVPGNVHLADFGIAKVSEATAQLTGSAIIGTPAYIAPEMGDRGEISPGVDVYAVGVTLYQMLSGQLPFQGDTPMRLVIAHMTKPVPNLHEFRPDLSPVVADVIYTALAKSPAERYASVGALSQAFDTALQGAEVEVDERTIPMMPEETIPDAVVPPPSPAPSLEAPTYDVLSDAPPVSRDASTIPDATPAPVSTPAPAPVAVPKPATPRRMTLPGAPRSKTGALLLGGAVVAAFVGLLAIIVIVAILVTRTPATPTTPVPPDFNFSGRGRDTTLRMTDNEAEDIDPAYGPNGTRLAFASDRDGDFEIYQLGADGNVTQLTINSAADVDPAYAPFGGKIAFASDRDGDYEIYVLDADGLVTQFTSNTATDLEPAYSPRGSELAFASNRDGQFEIYTLASDGEVLQLTRTTDGSSQLAVSPTGSLAYVGKVARGTDLFVLSPDS